MNVLCDNVRWDNSNNKRVNSWYPEDLWPFQSSWSGAWLGKRLMDSSSLMGLAMLVPIIGLPQGHANGKTIKTIPNVPLNTNNVLSCYQELKYSGFSSAESLPWTKLSMIGVIGIKMRSFQTLPKWNQTRSSTLKLHGEVKQNIAQEVYTGGLILANVGEKTCKLREKKKTLQKSRLP